MRNTQAVMIDHQERLNALKATTTSPLEVLSFLSVEHFTTRSLYVCKAEKPNIKLKAFIIIDDNGSYICMFKRKKDLQREIKSIVLSEAKLDKKRDESSSNTWPFSSSDKVEWSSCDFCETYFPTSTLRETEFGFVCYACEKIISDANFSGSYKTDKEGTVRGPKNDPNWYYDKVTDESDDIQILAPAQHEHYQKCEICNQIEECITIRISGVRSYVCQECYDGFWKASDDMEETKEILANYYCSRCQTESISSEFSKTSKLCAECLVEEIGVDRILTDCCRETIDVVQNYLARILAQQNDAQVPRISIAAQEVMRVIEGHERGNNNTPFSSDEVEEIRMKEEELEKEAADVDFYLTNSLLGGEESCAG